MSEISTTVRQPMRSGANALGIVPTTIADVWTIAKYIVMGKMAPDGLTKNRDADEQASAVSTIILSGLELGLSPMVSLRSFGMINGKPGLYGDGLINVCRRHSTAEYVKLGFTPGKTEEFGDDAFGWCEAKRSDTGEVSREEFSVSDAKRATLWEANATARRKVWENGAQVWKNDAPNDATWYRYPKRMLQWRAAGYCLRNLFADVLGGIPSMDELQEVYGEEEPRDITPAAQITRSGPPPIPDEPETDEGATDVPDMDAILSEIEDALSQSSTADEVDEAFDALDIQSRLTGDEDALTKAFEIKAAHVTRVSEE